MAITRFSVRTNGRDLAAVRRPRAAPKPVNPASLKKAELVELAESQGVDTSGTKAEIAERLGASDD